MAMNIQTQYHYEKTWLDTKEKDLLRMIEEELGDDEAQGVLSYVREAVKTGKVINIGRCKFRKKEETLKKK